MKQTDTDTAAIGLKAKTGRAIAVVLRGPAKSPQVIGRTELTLTDASVPATGQPYHEVMDLPWSEAQVRVRPFIKAIEAAAKQALAQLLSDLEPQGLKVLGVGITGSADRDLARIGNPHIRAHAAEGVIFRRVLETAADASGLAKHTFNERDIEALAAARLEFSVARLNGHLSNLGRPLGPPWRTDHRIAATAAWLTLLS